MESLDKPHSRILYRSKYPWMRNLEFFLERVLRFEHGANIIPFAHIFGYFIVLYLLITQYFSSVAINVFLYMALLMANYSLTIGVHHMHSHRKLFTHKVPNRITEWILALPGGVSYPSMKYVHVYLHHRYDNGDEDPTSTKGKETGWRAVQYWLSYAWVVHHVTIKGLFAADAKPAWARLRRQHIIDTASSVAFGVALAVYDPVVFLMFYAIPFIVVHINIGYFAWLTHAPAREGVLNGSVNTTNNWMNFFVHNQGYHTLHHMKPSIHWTTIPDHFHLLKDVDDDLIVPYWVSLESSYRIGKPDSFRDKLFGARWKAKFSQLQDNERFRLRFLPYFGWV